MIISIILLAIVFILIAIRQIGRLKLQIWQIMLFASIIVLVTGEISFKDALASINSDVILFLFGMFIIGQALEDSGYLSALSYKLFGKARSVNQLIFLILFGIGIASAFLMNDTLAIIGTPVALILAKKWNLSPKLMLITLAFSITIGSVLSPIGNPQNLLIAINSNLKNPFITFFKYLLLPTILNLFITYLLLKIFFKKEFVKKKIDYVKEPITDKKLRNLSKISLILLVLLILIKIAIVFLSLNIDFKLTYIALISALPIILFSEKRIDIVKKIDWYTLIFFASMFVFMQSVWNTGFFQNIITNFDVNIASMAMILIISILLSQLISNVPLVALYLPMLIHAGVSNKELMALASGSTIAGNLFILGAASNIIIIQNAEKRGETLTFLEFAKIGIPLTIINFLVYWLFLT